jgi:hypothetical protein
MRGPSVWRWPRPVATASASADPWGVVAPGRDHQGLARALRRHGGRLKLIRCCSCQQWLQTAPAAAVSRAGLVTAGWLPGGGAKPLGHAAVPQQVPHTTSQLGGAAASGCISARGAELGVGWTLLTAWSACGMLCHVVLNSGSTSLVCSSEGWCLPTGLPSGLATSSAVHYCCVAAAMMYCCLSACAARCSLPPAGPP